jgi:hypothetical protein
MNKWRMQSTGLRIVTVIAVGTIVSGCAHHFEPQVIADPYGFFSGVWHGIIFPFALLTNCISWCLSLVGIEFLANIELVGRPNTGLFFYYVGYLIGFSSYAGANAA